MVKEQGERGKGDSEDEGEGGGGEKKKVDALVEELCKRKVREEREEAGRGKDDRE